MPPNKLYDGTEFLFILIHKKMKSANLLITIGFLIINKKITYRLNCNKKIKLEFIND